MTIPPITTSISDALSEGFSRLDHAAAELAQPQEVAPPTDSVELSGQGLSGGPTEDPMIAGITDLEMARTQIEAGTLLLHAYTVDRRGLFDLLK